MDNVLKFPTITQDQTEHEMISTRLEYLTDYFQKKADINTEYGYIYMQVATAFYLFEAYKDVLED